MSIQKFVKDSCKGNLRQYFTDIRDSLGRGDNVGARAAEVSALPHP